MGFILGIISLVLLIVIYTKLRGDFYNNKLRILFIFFTLIFIFFVPVLPILVFLICLIYTMRMNKRDKSKRNKTMQIFCVGALIMSLLAINFNLENDSLKNTNNKSDSKVESKYPTKQQIDKMSHEELYEYVSNLEEKGRELYKHDKNLYKYAFKKYTKKDYDSIKIPREETILNTKDSLTLEQQYKLDIENEDLYLKYLSLQSEKYKKSEKDTTSTEETTDNTTDDGENLKKAIKSELTHGTIESVIYNNDSLGKNAVIVIKGKENLTDQMTIDGMRRAVAQSVKAVKDSEVDIESFTVDITYPVEDNEGKVNSDFHVIKSHWSMDKIKNLSNDQMELLNTELDTHADSYNESTALK